jgi:asparagine synthetase B (glutamine-hydrolysing)
MRDSLEHRGPDDKGIFYRKILDLVMTTFILDISSSPTFLSENGRCDDLQW